MGKTKTKTRTVEDSPKPPITIRSTNVKILDDNIAKLEKAIQAGDVSANPSGTAEETLLSSIGIDGKKYELGPEAENTSYDNTDSGLTADDVQAAIDELAPALTAEGTLYDNTDSGLTADDVQEAIDELAGSVVKQVSYTATTNATGAVSGASTDYGMSANALVLSVYVEKTGELSNARWAEVFTYGSKGYSFRIMDNDQPVASTEVTLSICYVDRKVNN